MSELRLRIHLRNGVIQEVVRTLPEAPGPLADDAGWHARSAAEIIEQIGQRGTWIKPRAFVPASSIEFIEFVSGPIPPELV